MRKMLIDLLLPNPQVLREFNCVHLSLSQEVYDVLANRGHLALGVLRGPLVFEPFPLDRGHHIAAVTEDLFLVAIDFKSLDKLSA
jgi:hypothetical protein